MWNGYLLRSFATIVFSAALVSAASSNAAEPIRGYSSDDWRGWGVMTGGKGYAPTPMGQVHYRDLGPRDSKYPIVLMHQSPMSMVQFAEVQNALVEMGVRAIALDTPGYGNSDQPSKQPTIRDYADNLVHVFNHLNLERVVVAGHHTGGLIAASFAANHPDRVSAIIIHGSALATQEEWDGYLSRKAADRTPRADGAHLRRSFQPQTPPDRQAILDAKMWGLITSYIQGPDTGHWAAFHYDMLPDLKAIKVPGMILSDLQDGIHFMDLRTAEVRPDFKYVEFSKGDLLEFMAEPKRWATFAVDFMSTLE